MLHEDAETNAMLPGEGRPWSAEHNMGVYTLHDVFVNHEALIFRHGRPYPESFVAHMYLERWRSRRRPGWFLAKNYWLRRGSVPVPSGLWAIDNFTVDNYHHWLVDVLPRLVIAEGMYPSERLLLLPRYYRHPYISFTLRAFPQVARIGWIGARTKVRVGRLQFVPRTPVYVRELVAEVARRVADLAGVPGTARRVYFSRDDASRRRISNEREVVSLLRSYDFEIVHIDPAKPWEQIRASLGAELIVGPHGAALTNLIFMPEHGRLLELRHAHDDVFFKAYRALAEVAGVGYRAQRCELAREASGYDINDADLIVDLEVLRDNLQDLTS